VAPQKGLILKDSDAFYSQATHLPSLCLPINLHVFLMPQCIHYYLDIQLSYLYTRPFEKMGTKNRRIFNMKC